MVGPLRPGTWERSSHSARVKHPDSCIVAGRWRTGSCCAAWWRLVRWVTLTKEAAVSSRHSVGPTQAEILMADRGDKNSANKKNPRWGREGLGLWGVVGGGKGEQSKKDFFLSGCFVCFFPLMEKYSWLRLTGGHLVEFGSVWWAHYSRGLLHWQV